MDTTLQPFALKGNNTFTCVIEDNIEEMELDRIKLHQILLNLLSNACRFTEQGNILLKVHSEIRNGKEMLSFIVTDTGKGLATEEISTIFQEFSQAGKAEDKLKGTGLGLAISHKFCQLLGGAIHVQSEVNVGTTFTVNLPRYISDESAGLKCAENAA